MQHEKISDCCTQIRDRVTPLLSFPQNKNNQPERSLIIIRKEIKGSYLDTHCNHHGNKCEKKLKD